MVASKKQTLTSLKAGRPPLSKSSRTMSRKASRSLINTHHQLEKKRRQAAARGDKAEEAAVTKELTKLGGLDHYQQASLQGQSHERGGDTSKVLLDWLPTGSLKSRNEPIRMLEVGALSTKNACSTSGAFDVVHIDLHSQEPGILEQDFMDRPLPTDESDKFDIISLSLVLNFVSEAEGRGRMLLRTLSFLYDKSRVLLPGKEEQLFPCLFLVLPRSCVTNSRYFTEQRLEQIMNALGYVKTHSKLTQKLIYTLWRRENRKMGRIVNFPKKEVNPGRTRNNFVITLNEMSIP